MYTEGTGREGPIAAWGQAGHWSTGGEQLYCASLVFLGFHFSFYPLFITISIIIININIFIIIIFYFISTLKLFLSQPRGFTSLLPQLLFSHLEREWASICVVLSCRLRLNHNKALQEILAFQSLLMKLINTWNKTELNVNDYSVKVIVYNVKLGRNVLLKFSFLKAITRTCTMLFLLPKTYLGRGCTEVVWSVTNEANFFFQVCSFFLEAICLGSLLQHDLPATGFSHTPPPRVPFLSPRQLSFLA